MVKNIPPTLLLSIKELWDQNLGSRAISAKLGVKRHVVQNAYEILGIKNSGRTFPRKIQLLTHKTCKLCSETKSIEEFRAHKRTSPLGDFTMLIEPYCKPCENIKQKEYRNNNLEKIREASRLSNKKRIDKIRENNRMKWATDPNFKLRKIVSHQIREELFSNDSSKDGISCMDYLPYTIEELRLHLDSLFEPWMTWENWGCYSKDTWDDNDPSTWTWHLDHIVPHSTFKYTSMEDQAFRDCWTLSNLRPYSAKQNQIDNDRGYRKAQSITMHKTA